LSAGWDSAVSGASRAARDALGALVRSVETSQALFGRKAAVISDIWALVNECAEADWDASGAEAVDRLAAFRAVEVIRALPTALPLPEVAGEPDGAISLDWIVSRHQLFSLSVGAGDRLAYAWLDGSNRGHGVDRFDGAAVPTRILQGIREVLKHGDATVRST
jgi:hypothetical protein